MFLLEIDGRVNGHRIRLARPVLDVGLRLGQQLGKVEGLHVGRIDVGHIDAGSGAVRRRRDGKPAPQIFDCFGDLVTEEYWDNKEMVHTYILGESVMGRRVVVHGRSVAAKLKWFDRVDSRRDAEREHAVMRV